MMTVVDYQAGNLYNVGNALARLGVEYRFSNDPDVVAKSQKVVLPGVGAARPAMDSLKRSGLADVLPQLTVPFLGICLGHQLLFDETEESQTPCLGVIPGVVRKFRTGENGLKVPHIGWNQVKTTAYQTDLFEGIADEEWFYFVHSFYATCRQKEQVAAETSYGEVFVSAVMRKNFYGVQFHPERSGKAGLQVLWNFANQVGRRG